MSDLQGDNAPLMAFHNLTHEMQAQAKTCGSARLRAALEFIKDPLMLARWNTRSLVSHANLEMIRFLIQDKGNLCVLRAELDCIFPEVKNSLQKKRLVPYKWRSSIGLFQDKTNVFFSSPGSECFHGVIHHAARRKRHAADLLPSTFQTGNVKKIRNHVL